MLKPKETSEIMQLDGTMAGATAIIEMLVHEKQGVVHVFPAVPDKWLDISFKNVRLPGAFLISAERRNGKMTSLNIKSLKGGSMELKPADDATVVKLQFAPGEEYFLKDTILESDIDHLKVLAPVTGQAVR